MSMLLLVLANAIITATMKHTHKEIVDRRTIRLYKNIEVLTIKSIPIIYMNLNKIK